jgi:type III secretion apparatus needle protein
MAELSSVLNFGTLIGNLGTNLTAFETRINEAASKADLTTADLLVLQKDVTEWSIFVNTSSSVIKALGDELKGILQRIN